MFRPKRYFDFMRLWVLLTGFIWTTVALPHTAAAQDTVEPANNTVWTTTLANPNPNNFDTPNIMSALFNPHSDLVMLSAHRGIHALAGLSQAAGVPENSLQSIGLAAQAGWEMIELDVKLTSDGVPILSHDKTWGREWCGLGSIFSPGSANPYNPFTPPGSIFNDAKNPTVNGTLLSDTRSFLGNTVLRDSVSLLNAVNNGCNGFNNAFGEYPPTLADALDYISKNHIRMVVLLDIQGIDVARAALPIVKAKNDDLGRSFLTSAVFKMPATLFPNGTTDFFTTFGSDSQHVIFIPVINTANVAPTTTTITDTEDGGFDVTDFGNNGFGGEQGIVNWLASMHSGPVQMAAVEVNLKEPGGILTQTVLPAAKQNQQVTVGAFNPVGEFYPNGDTTQTPQFFRSSNGSCCDILNQYLYNNPNGTGPIDPTQPVDHSDQRTNLSFLLGQGFQYLITDDPTSASNLLQQQNKRNLCYMQQPEAEWANCTQAQAPAATCQAGNPACLSAGTIGTPPTPPGLIGTASPATNFNLTQWELQLPTGTPGNPTTISSAQLQAGFQDQYFFTNSSDGSLGMKDPGINCVTTPNSAHCRTELREMNADGSAASWFPSGTNKLDATLKVEDPGGSVVIGQVHLAGEKPLAELYYDSAGNIEIGVEQTTAGGNQLRTFLGQVPVGTLFSYEINYSNNQLSVSINGGTPFVLNTFNVGGLASYFKAGAYGQTTSPSDVHFFKLQITHAGTINTNGWYNVVNVNSGLCADVFAFGTALGTSLDQWQCGNGQANQQWQLTPVGNGVYQVNSRFVAMSWNVTGGVGATGNQVPIQLWSYGGASNEQWQAVPLGADSNWNGICKFIAQNSGLCLDVPSASKLDGQQLDQFSCNGTNAQAFTLVPVTPAAGNPVAPTAAAPPPPPTPNPTAWYNVVNVNSGLCVDDLNFGTALGSVVDQWSCGNGQANQQWQLTPTSNGFYQVSSRLVAMSWNITGGTGATGNQTPIQLWSFGGASNEQWKAAYLSTDSNGNNVYQFIAENDGLCLDVPGASTLNGQQLDQFSCNGTNAQAFTLVQVNPAPGNPVAPTAAAPPPPPTPNPNTWYNVVNVNDGSCVDVFDWGTALGTSLDQWTCGNGQANQQWQFTSVGNGLYQVNSRFVAMSWNVTGGTGAIGNQTPIQLWSYGGASNEQWQAIYLRTDGNGNNVFKLIAQNSGLCLDVPGASNANGLQLDQFSCNGTNAQAFTLVPVTPALGNPTAPTAAAPPPAPTPNPNAWYNVVNVNSGLCVDDLNFGTALGSVVDQWSCGNGQANQQWQLTPTGNGSYQVSSRFVAMSWDVTGGTGATGNQTPIQLWSYGGRSNEQWQAVYLRTDGNGNNVYNLIAQNSGLCLDVPGASNANGQRLDQFSCNGTNAQAFTLVQVNPAPGNPVAPTAPAPPPPPTPNPNAWYNVVNVNNGSCVDVFDWGTALGTRLDQWTCGNDQANQQWQLTSVGNGVYQVHSRFVAMSWNVTGGTGATGNQTPIQLWSYGGDSNEQWKAVYLWTDGNGNNVYRFVAQNDGLCLDVPGASNANGLQLDQFSCNGTNAQAFTLVQVNPAPGNPVAPTAAAPPPTSSPTPPPSNPPPSGPQKLPANSPIGPGAWAIQNVNSGLCLDVFGGQQTAGAALDQWPCGVGPSQQWWFSPATFFGISYNIEDGYGTIIDVAGGPSVTWNQAGIDLWTMNDQTNDQWVAVRLPSGAYNFVSVSSGKCLDVPFSSTSKGLRLDQYDCNGTNAQAFWVYPAPTSSAGGSSGGGSSGGNGPGGGCSIGPLGTACRQPD